MYGRGVSRSSTSPVMKVSASQGILPSSRKILRLSRAHSLSESLNSYCVRWKERRREGIMREGGRWREGGREGEDTQDHVSQCLLHYVNIEIQTLMFQPRGPNFFLS